MTLPRPTVLGVKALGFYAVLTGAFLAAPYWNLFFLLIAFLSVLGLLTLWWAFRSLAGVAGELADPGPVPAGAPADLTVRYDAGSRFRPGVHVALVLGGPGREDAGTGDLDGAGELAARLPALPRGIHAIRAARFETDWPFGLLRSRISIAAPPEIVVYPAPAELPGAKGGTGGLSELLGPAASRDGFLQPSELREYRVGDELRRVHWKASARRGTLVVTEWDGGAGDGLEVVLDLRAREEELERALSLLAALALAARDEKELVTLHTQGLSGTFGGNHRPREELLRFLAGAEPLPADAPPPPPASPEVLRLPVREGTR